MVSKLSSSTVSAATSGRYQPLGGGGRRLRLRPSKTPRRRRIRLIVGIDGHGSTFRAPISRRIAAAPYSPNTLWSLSHWRIVSTSCSSAGLVRRVRFGAGGRSVQSTPIQTSPLGPREPALHGAQRHTKLIGNCTLRGSTAHGGYQGPSLLWRDVFVPWQSPGRFSLWYRRICSTRQPSADPPGGIASDGGRNSSRATPSFRSAPHPKSKFSL